MQEARSLGIRCAATSTVIACPFDGPTRPKRVAALAERLLDLGCHEISLGDTIGVGTPGTVAPCWMRCCTRSRRAGLRFIFTTPTARAGQPAAGARARDPHHRLLGGRARRLPPPAPPAMWASEEVVYLLHGLGMSTGSISTSWPPPASG